MRSQAAGIVSPFWLPDTLSYRTDAIAHIVVSIAASVIFVPENCALAEVTARLVVNEQRPDVSHVLVHIQGAPGFRSGCPTTSPSSPPDGRS